jgi:hypothetical protein
MSRLMTNMRTGVCVCAEYVRIRTGQVVRILLDVLVIALPKGINGPLSQNTNWSLV